MRAKAAPAGVSLTSTSIAGYRYIRQFNTFKEAGENNAIEKVFHGIEPKRSRQSRSDFRTNGQLRSRSRPSNRSMKAVRPCCNHGYR
jgi:hypothetical protein